MPWLGFALSAASLLASGAVENTVSGFGHRAPGLGHRGSGFGLRVSRLGFRATGIGLRGSGIGVRTLVGAHALCNRNSVLEAPGLFNGLNGLFLCALRDMLRLEIFELNSAFLSAVRLRGMTPVPVFKGAVMTEFNCQGSRNCCCGILDGCLLKKFHEFEDIFEADRNAGVSF